MNTKCLYHKGEAIRLLNERLLCPQLAISDMTFVVIMILTGVEVRLSTFSTFQGFLSLLNISAVSEGQQVHS